MPTIVLDDGTIVDAPDNKRLVLALEDSGVDILHRCGGNARCTACRVMFTAGEPELMTVAERDRLAENGLFGQFRLSCQIRCNHDMVLRFINRLSASTYPDAGNRPKDTVTPEAVWIKRPGN
jgi:ferredoxin